ncbi:hypothetical protein SAMN04487928_101230 [Butyrivibrio proteoclasticus]|uniref:Apea-like HEPN domain-containing protein n=2 Tax=Butyrivibrio proteoclasticus TaxID=43305 RepID=A0A1I5PZS4_9FIRM|nr:hypothetical protein SAMN04487928_101230 [Butyrivibrio proteoclasticus]
MIYSYNVKVPLSYNCFEINTYKPDLETRFEIENEVVTEINVVFRAYDITGYPEGYDFRDTLEIRLYTTRDENLDKVTGMTASIKGAVAPYITCEINGILVDGEEYAIKFAEEITGKICKEVSLVLIRHNFNRHLFQPRIEPNWRMAVWNHSEYAQYMAVKDKATEEGDGARNRIVRVHDNMHMVDAVYIMSTITVNSNEFDLGSCLYPKDDTVEFLVNEYYSALGSEKLKSKFFHLFTMIEFVEQKYEKYNGAATLLKSDEVDHIIDVIKSELTEQNKGRIVSSVKDLLLKMNDTGRAQKLLNILDWMGIKKYRRFGDDSTIDKNLLDEIIGVRNKSFHGAAEKESEAERKYGNAVEKLLYINEQIIEYVRKENQVEIPEEGYVLITGRIK